jgi:hypothetical protein
MDASISPGKLNNLLGAFPPLLLTDVRRPAAFDASLRLLPCAIHRAPTISGNGAGDLEIAA